MPSPELKVGSFVRPRYAEDNPPVVGIVQSRNSIFALVLWVTENRIDSHSPDVLVPIVRYVNAYAVDRVFGGHEEGGWWFDAGEPLASVPVATEQEADAARTRLRELFADDYRQPHGRTRSSVIGGPDLEVYTEDHMARPFPDRRPQYE